MGTGEGEKVGIRGRGKVGTRGKKKMESRIRMSWGGLGSGRGVVGFFLKCSPRKWHEIGGSQAQQGRSEGRMACSVGGRSEYRQEAQGHLQED